MSSSVSGMDCCLASTLLLLFWSCVDGRVAQGHAHSARRHKAAAHGMAQQGRQQGRHVINAILTDCILCLRPAWYAHAPATDKATSELLPLDDESVLLTSLQLSDVIRSKGVEPAAALKSLRRRLSHKNFNVQILALNVCDILVKNSGEAFNLQVANGKEGWMAQLEELCRSVNCLMMLLEVS